MKYLMTVFFATTMSFGAFALGQGPGATGSQDCCTSGRCGGGMPLCGAPRDSQRRESAALKNYQLPKLNKKAKGTKQ